MTKMMSTKDITNSKKLYSLFLDLWYAVRGYEDRVSDLMEELKDHRKSLRKAKKYLDKVSAKFEEITGNTPTNPKGY